MASEYESDMLNILVPKVILVENGAVLENVLLSKKRLIREEKERILREAQIPYPALFEMMLHGPHGSFEILNDSRSVKDIPDLSTDCEIYIQPRGYQEERPPRSIKPELLKINMKQGPI